MFLSLSQITVSVSGSRAEALPTLSSATVTVLQALQQGQVSRGHHTGVVGGVQLLENNNDWSGQLAHKGGGGPYLVPIRAFTGGEMIDRNTDGVGAALLEAGTRVPAYSIPTLLK